MRIVQSLEQLSQIVHMKVHVTLRICNVVIATRQLARQRGDIKELIGTLFGISGLLIGLELIGINHPNF